MPDPSFPSPEQIREFPDRGALWLLEDPAMLRDLLRLLEPALADRLDFARAIRVNRSFIPADLQKKESDLIFRVPFPIPAAEPEVWVYVLLEHQSSPDRLMPLRLLAYMVEVWKSQVREWEDARTPADERRLRTVIPLVFYTGQEGWRTPLRLSDLMQTPPELVRFVPGWETLFLNLHQTSPATLTGIASAVGYALRVLQAEPAPRAELEAALSEALAGLEGLTEEQAGQWLRAAWYLILLVFHRREAEEYTELGGLIVERSRRSKFRLREEVARMGKTMAQVIEERGIALGEERGIALGEERGIALGEERGEARGRTEGEAIGLRRALETVLVSRFGPLPPGVEATLAAADMDTLDAWLRRAASAKSLAELGLLTTPPRG